MAALESIGEPPQENLDIATSTSIRPNRVEDFFHLVLVHNHGENGRSHATRPFWSNLFTNALVSEFCISDTNSTVRYTLLRNAQALLRKIAGDRTHWRYDDSDAPKPGEYVPCVFLGFGIGRYVIQQAMVLASQDYVYRHLPNDTAALFLVLDPMKTNGKLPWIIHVAFNFIPDRKLSLGEMLENLNRDYENVGCSCDIINIPDLALDYDVPPRKVR
ncbi:hypothetical protein F4779DRAFT_34506 [Xylariaceae sp. FL0662B]|nr:hypothetical protein F4779DRAFT_34506 [Xylariaceae sp. FL0662B]